MPKTLKRHLIKQFGYGSYAVLEKKVGAKEALKFGYMFLTGFAILLWVILTSILIGLDVALASKSADLKNFRTVFYGVSLLILLSSIGYSSYLNLTLYRKHGLILYHRKIGARLISNKELGVLVAILRNTALVTSVLGLIVAFLFPLILLSILITGKI